MPWRLLRRLLAERWRISPLAVDWVSMEEVAAELREMEIEAECRPLKT